MTKKVPIKYTARDFESIRDSLLDYTKRYYPNTYKDFSEASFGSLVMDEVSIIGDSLSWFIDYAVNESFFETSLEYNNIIRHGRSRGWSFTGNPSSYGIATFYILVPAASNSQGPDSRYYPVLKVGSQFSSADGKSFVLSEDVVFSATGNDILVAQIGDNGYPTYYAVRAKGQVVSGEFVYEEIVVGDYEKFPKLELTSDDIAEVVSVVDSSGKEYYEVDSLSQNIIYKAIPNYTSSREYAAYLMKPYAVPRRFVVERERRKTYLQFGQGNDSDDATMDLVEPANVFLNIYGKDYISTDSFDPSRLVKSDSLGIAPSNTTLRIKVRKNTTDNVNIGVGTLVRVGEAVYEFDNVNQLSTSILSTIKSSLEVTNDEPITGDITLPSTEELKKRIMGAFSSQKRAVSSEDYRFVCYGMPAKFGSVKRVNVVKDNNSFKRNLNLYVVSEDQDGYLTETNTTIKNNLKTWITQYKMINDTVDILDARIVNFGINFEVISYPSKEKYEVLESCISALKDAMKIKFDIGQSLSKSEIFKTLNAVDGVVDTTKVEIVEKRGGVYSDFGFDFDKFASADDLFIECPKNCVFELRDFEADVKGVVR